MEKEGIKTAKVETSAEIPKDKVEEHEVRVLAPREGEATVGAEFGLTINMGNFNSMRLSASATLPCGASKEDLTAGYKEAWKLVLEEVIGMRKKLEERISFSPK